jgi:hypothetical protein
VRGDGICTALRLVAELAKLVAVDAHSGVCVDGGARHDLAASHPLTMYQLRWARALVSRKLAYRPLPSAQRSVVSGGAATRRAAEHEGINDGSNCTAGHKVADLASTDWTRFLALVLPFTDAAPAESVEMSRLASMSQQSAGATQDVTNHALVALRAATHWIPHHRIDADAAQQLPMRHLNEQSLVVAVPLLRIHGQLPPGRQESDFQLCNDCESVTLEESTRGVVQITQVETFAPAPEQNARTCQ